MDHIELLTRPDGETLAVRRRAGAGPTLLWIGGYRSDMEGTKAVALDQAATERGWAYVRYDHFAHGASSGDWRQATIGRWAEDAAAVIDSIEGPVLPVGSSMGGWLALLLQALRPERIAATVLIAPAADFSERLAWPALEDHVRQAILRDGEAMVSEEGLGDYILTRRFFEDGRDRRVLDRPIAAAGPIHILQGRLDESVPWRHAVETVTMIEGADVGLELIEDGDHRLSRPQDLARMIAAVETLRRL